MSETCCAQYGPAGRELRRRGHRLLRCCQRGGEGLGIQQQEAEEPDQNRREHGEEITHISTLTDDYYVYDEEANSLFGKKTKKRYRLGDQITIEVVRIDRTRRQVDFRVADEPKPEKKKKKEAKSPQRKRG